MYDLQERVVRYNASGQVALQPDITERLVATVHSRLEILANVGSKAVDVLYTPVTELLSYVYSALVTDVLYSRKGHIKGGKQRGAKRLHDRSEDASQVGEATTDMVEALLRTVRQYNETNPGKKKKKRRQRI